MILANIWIQSGIVAGVIILFLLACYFNGKTKLPKGVDLPDKCQTCASNTCMIKSKDIDEIKNDLKQYLNECEGEDNEK